MTSAAPEQARIFAAWLDTLDTGAEPVAIALGEVAEPEWQSVISSLAEPFDCAAVSRVIARAHELLGRSPRDAQCLARLALRMTSHLDPSTCDLPLIEGDAWRECAAAHLEMAENTDAYEAILQARARYARSKASRLNRAILSLIEGRALFELGRTSDALQAADRGASELLKCKANPKKYVQAKTIYAAILVGSKRYLEALDVFDEAADLAVKAGDQETLAYILMDVGLCALALDDSGRAKRCFEGALQYFDGLGLWYEMPRVRTNMVEVLKVQGRYNEAISELFKIRAEFLSLGTPVRAAITELQIVQILLLSGRGDVVPLCNEMVKTFKAARLQENLLGALAYLNHAAKERRLAPADVTYVAQFIEHAHKDPDRAFVRPAP